MLGNYKYRDIAQATRQDAAQLWGKEHVRGSKQGQT